MKENIIAIDLTTTDLKGQIISILKDVFNSFFCENKEIKLDEIILKNDFISVILEVLNGDLRNVKDRVLLYRLFERVYDYWRNYKRYLYAFDGKSYFVNKDNFLENFEHFNHIILNSYRQICQNLTGKSFNVLRQLPAGANAGVYFVNNEHTPYEKLAGIDFVEKIAFQTPFVAYSLSNTRKGVFPLTDKNPIDELKARKEEWKCFPILVGNSKIFVYFKERYISLALSLANLFEHDDNYKNEDPDGIVLFGSNTEDGIYFDQSKKIYIGALEERDEIDYFGYLKKIILTVHNLKMIEENKLPIHGAGVSILMKNGKRKNVVLVGDSGAGKSETLEALRHIASGFITDIETIYDDMGTLEIKDGKVVTYGTEVGAFVRIDDLANDYVYKVFDRAIFLNPNLKNARLVLPVSSYQTVVSEYKVDLLLYANNYEEKVNKIELFTDKEKALETFVEGKRVALGTTSESGLVKTFFANPFGPVQKEEKTKELLDEYFDLLFKNKVDVGTLYTGLALDSQNPNYSALAMLELLKEDK